MQLIVGLGNPGEKYENTRHNIGFRVLDKLATKKEFPDFKLQKKFFAELSKKNNIILFKPLTYMNKSGIAVSSFCNYYSITPKEIIVIHDDTDILLGKIKIDKNRSAAGHKGVQSIIDHLSTKDFWRIRIGIGINPAQAAKEITLQKFNLEEEIIVKKMISKAIKELSSPLQKKTIQKKN